MLCGIKWLAIISRKNAYRILKNGKFRVDQDYNSRREEWINGEPKTWVRNGKWIGWIIQVRKETSGYVLIVRGSLHKFFHGNNAGIFTITEAISALDGMFAMFEIEAESAIIKNIEIGVNVKFPYPVFQYLDVNLLHHKKKPYDYLASEYSKNKMIGFVFNHDDYVVKLYEKSEMLLRYELKYKSEKMLRQLGVVTGADLHERAIVALADTLHPQWGEVIMKDGVDVHDPKKDNLTESELKALRTYSSKWYRADYRKNLNEAKRINNGKKSKALQVQDWRLKNRCMDIIRKKGDGCHSITGQEILAAVLGLTDPLRVTFSPFVKTGENVTVKEINNTTEVAA